MEENKDFMDYLKEVENKIDLTDSQNILENYFYCNHIVEY